MDAYGSHSLHQAVVLPNRIPPAAGINRMEYGMDMYRMTSSSYLHEQGCVFEQPLLTSASQLFNEALEPMDDEETLRMNDEPINNIVEPLNNIALDMYTQEHPTLNFLNSAQSAAEEFATDFISPQCEGGNISHPNSVNVDQFGLVGALPEVTQFETSSLADLERNVDPFAAELSPKTYQEVVQSVKNDIYPLQPQGHGQASSPMEDGGTFNEYFSHGSQQVTTPHQSVSGYISSESLAEQLQLTTSSSIINPAPSPMIAQSPMTPCTPGTQKPCTPVQPNTPSAQCSEVEQMLSMDGSEVNVVFNSHKSATGCRNWYGALVQVVPEVVKPVQSMKKELIQIKLPEGALPLVTWCNINRSGIIRARIIQELARIIANLHQNKIAKGLCFFGGITLSESVFVTVEPCTGEPQLHIVPNMMAFWQFASSNNDKDPNTPRLGRLEDVKQFVKILEHTIMRPVKHKEFMVSYALYSACKFCMGEGTEGDKMPIFYQRLAGHKLACIQLSQENMTYDVVCYCHEILESCLTKLTHWKVVKPSVLSNPNTVVYGLYYGDRLMLCSEELPSEHLTINMRQLPVEKVRKMKGNPLLLALK